MVTLFWAWLKNKQKTIKMFIDDLIIYHRSDFIFEAKNDQIKHLPSVVVLAFS